MKILFSIGRLTKPPIKKTNKYIEIVVSSQSQFNSMAKASRLRVFAALNKHFTKVGMTTIDNLTDLEQLVAKKPDLVVLGVKFTHIGFSGTSGNSTKIRISDYLKQNNINFAGSDAEARSIGLIKHKAKLKVKQAGLQTSKHYISGLNQLALKNNLKFPLFVKPTNRGGSQGVDENSVVYSDSQLQSKILSIHEGYKSDALIEEYLPGREFSVAVTRQLGSNDLLAMPIEIKAPKDRNGNSFLSEAVKKADSEKVVAIKDPILKKAVNNLAIGVFGALGARDYGRIDMRLNAQGNPSFIEANLMPGLSSHGYMSRCFKINHKISYDDMIVSIINIALERATILSIEVPTTILENILDESLPKQLVSPGLIV